MIIFKKVSALKVHLQKVALKKATLGFVPTMGALHAGHLSLLQKSRQTADITVCSIFVNPTQFNDPRDFENYPVNLDQDVYLLEKAGCDILFVPPVDEIYPAPETNRKFFDLGHLNHILEGKHRPGHFQGVCMVVDRLLQILKPDFLFAGQKDYQQSLVLSRLLQLSGSPAKLVMCATLREKDGLAMSSRNTRLTKEERATAPELYRTLLYVREHMTPGKVEAVQSMAVHLLHKNNFKADYVEIARTGDLQKIEVWDGNEQVIILAAAFLNEVRLIDNLIFES